MAEEKPQGDAQSTLGMSDSERQSLLKLMPYMTPMVSPWMTLGAGGLMGLYSYYQNKKELPKQREMAARTMELSPWTGMKPEQTYFQEPSLVGNLLGGIGGAQGVTSSINAFLPAYNMEKALKADTKLKAQQAAEAAQAFEDGNNPYVNDEQYYKGMDSQFYSPWLV